MRAVSIVTYSNALIAQVGIIVAMGKIDPRVGPVLIASLGRRISYTAQLERIIVRVSKQIVSQYQPVSSPAAPHRKTNATADLSFFFLTALLFTD